MENKSLVGVIILAVVLVIAIAGGGVFMYLQNEDVKSLQEDVEEIVEVKKDVKDVKSSIDELSTRMNGEKNLESLKNEDGLYQINTSDKINELWASKGDAGTYPEGFNAIAYIDGYIENDCGVDEPKCDDLLIYAKDSWVASGSDAQELYLVVIGRGGGNFYGPFEEDLKELVMENLVKDDISQEEQDKVTEAILEAESNYIKYSNDEYKFSLEFPKGWGKIVRSGKDLGDKKNADNVDAFYLVSESDEDRYIYISVNKPEIMNTDYEDTPRKFLGKSSQYAYYYAGTGVPQACREEGGSTYYDCDKLEIIERDEVNRIIVPSFKIN